MAAKVDTTLKQWCPQCMASTVTRVCEAPPNLCCSRCCPPGRCRAPSEADDYWPEG